MSASCRIAFDLCIFATLPAGLAVLLEGRRVQGTGSDCPLNCQRKGTPRSDPVFRGQSLTVQGTVSGVRFFSREPTWLNQPVQGTRLGGSLACSSPSEMTLTLFGWTKFEQASPSSPVVPPSHLK